MQRVRSMRLLTHDHWIDVRWASFDGRWIASADTRDGPTLGVGWTRHQALTAALTPFGCSSVDAFDVIADDAGSDPSD